MVTEGRGDEKPVRSRVSTSLRKGYENGRQGTATMVLITSWKFRVRGSVFS